jgi:hypothetical protein
MCDYYVDFLEVLEVSLEPRPPLKAPLMVCWLREQPLNEAIFSKDFNFFWYVCKYIVIWEGSRCQVPCSGLNSNLFLGPCLH